MQYCFKVEILFCISLVDSVPIYKCWSLFFNWGATGRYYTMWTSPREHLAVLNESYWRKYRNRLLNIKALLSLWLIWVKLETPLFRFSASVKLYSRQNKSALTKGDLNSGGGREETPKSIMIEDLSWIILSVNLNTFRLGTQANRVSYSVGGDSSHRYGELGIRRLWYLQLH